MIKDKLFVSVIIPNYCHSRFLTQRIQSVLNQSYKNLEIIILDDASPDDGASRDIIEKYRGNSFVSHIVYNEHNSGSAFKQWQKGFELAKGDLIWIAESDDYCDSVFLETLISEFYKDENCVLAFTKSLHVDSCGNSIEPIKMDYSIERLKGIPFIQKYLCVGNTVENASAALFRRESVFNINMQYTTFKGAGDQLFWMLIAEHGNVVYNHTPLSCFRQHDKNTTQRLYADGTTFRELHEIYLYACKKKFIKTWRKRLNIKNYFIHWILDSVRDESKKRELLRLWDPFKIMSMYSYLVDFRDSIKSKI